MVIPILINAYVRQLLYKSSIYVFHVGCWIRPVGWKYISILQCTSWLDLANYVGYTQLYKLKEWNMFPIFSCHLISIFFFFISDKHPHLGYSI